MRTQTIKLTSKWRKAEKRVAGSPLRIALIIFVIRILPLWIIICGGLCGEEKERVLHCPHAPRSRRLSRSLADLFTRPDGIDFRDILDEDFPVARMAGFGSFFNRLNRLEIVFLLDHEKKHQLRQGVIADLSDPDSPLAPAAP